MAKKMICSNGCSANFNATAHVVQEWQVDASGNYVNVLRECIEVTHKPNPENIWSCLKCGGEGRWDDDVNEPAPEKAAAQEKTENEMPATYQATFYLTLKPGYEISEISKSLSNAIAEEINIEFPEIDFVSFCEIKQDQNK